MLTNVILIFDKLLSSFIVFFSLKHLFLVVISSSRHLPIINTVKKYFFLKLIVFLLHIKEKSLKVKWKLWLECILVSQGDTKKKEVSARCTSQLWVFVIRSPEKLFPLLLILPQSESCLILSLLMLLDTYYNHISEAQFINGY